MWAARVAIVVLVAGCGSSGATTGRLAEAITDGQEDTHHLAVGYIDKGDGSVGCSATLVGRRTVLTAGHCVWPDHQQEVVLDHARYRAETGVYHPELDPVTHVNDIGLLRLERMTHVVPARVASRAARVGETVTLVGYGATAEDADDQGVRRSAENVVSDLGVSFFAFAGSGAGRGNVCHQDSGAPALVHGDDDREAQAGVVIGGDPPCGTRGFATRVDLHLAWLEQQAGGDLALEGRPAAFGQPCLGDADCRSGICRTGATPAPYCTSPCSQNRPCADDAPCDADGLCTLPAPPGEETGCAMGGSSSPPGPALLLLFLPVLALAASRPRRQGA